MKTKYIRINTAGNNDIINITPYLEEILGEEKIRDGILFLNVIGSTAALTTMEYESGLVEDLKSLFDKIIPYRKDWQHNFTWSDDNAHSHLRSSLLKTNLFVSVTDGKLDLGTWQQVVLIDFDTRPRERKVIVKIIF
ncbi:MAG: secondary thiamine-phosphate synthase enzyme YjbQ [Candidatus Omnitrophica bacterium]|nr:secondary thiamine-phosphate synthase enzyme YjbQ [Candidatus Omnitrophota bacterium]